MNYKLLLQDTISPFEFFSFSYYDLEFLLLPHNLKLIISKIRSVMDFPLPESGNFFECTESIARCFKMLLIFCASVLNLFSFVLLVLRPSAIFTPNWKAALIMKRSHEGAIILNNKHPYFGSASRISLYAFQLSSSSKSHLFNLPFLEPPKSSEIQRK